jgi:Ser/Thr protein kinase RdoA (MazF antagonist)
MSVSGEVRRLQTRALRHNRRMTDTSAAQHPYAELTPDRVMDALSELGLWPDGRLLALSSYENRVYRVHLDEAEQGHKAVVLKFYRPGRWSRAQIQEEHDFAAELVAGEVPMVAPLTIGGQTLSLIHI